MLLPVLDDDKHYWVDEAEIEKLMRARRGLAAGAPERELITRRYLKHQRRLFNPALAQLADEAPVDEAETAGDGRALGGAGLAARAAARRGRGGAEAQRRAPGARPRLRAGPLLQRLLRDGCERVVGVDVSVRALEGAARRLDLDRMHEAERARIELLQSPLTYRDQRLAGFDAAALVEVIEHLDPPGSPRSRPTSSARRGRGRWW